MVPHENVLWIGGPSGVGKSTVARLLARRHGLRWYSGDTRTWDHRDRAIRVNDPAALRFEGLTPQERANLPHAERETLGLIPQRRRMILDDLDDLQDSPIVIAESTLLEPAMTDPHRTVWLVAEADRLIARTTRRGWGTRTPADARAHLDDHRSLVTGTEIPVIDCDDMTIPEILDRVTDLFAAHLACGPLASGRAQRQQLVREGNLAISHQYRAGLARYGRLAELPNTTRTFDCECGGRRCRALLEIPVSCAPATIDDPPLLAAGCLTFTA